MTRRPVPLVNRRNARRMRKQLTDAELKLWNELRAHRLMGLAFRRQMPIAGYIVDFACAEHKLIVEVDGSQHAAAGAADADLARRAKLEALGWTVLRFWNDDVLRDIDNVCQYIVISASLAGPAEQGGYTHETGADEMIDHYGAFVIDPDGNNVEAVCHAPE